MKQFRQRQRIFILSLLSLSVVAPLIFVSHRLKLLTPLGRMEFLEDFYRVTYRTDTFKLNAVEQEGSEELEEPSQIVYKERDVSTISYNSVNNNDSEESRIAGYRSTPLERNVSGFNHDKRQHQGAQQKDLSSTAEDTNMHAYSHRTPKENVKVTNRPLVQKATTHHHHILDPHSNKVENQKVQEIKDQIVMAKTYLNIASPSSNSRLKELELQMKEMERAVGEATLDSDLSRSVLQEMRRMEASLSDVSRAFPDCSAMAAKLHAIKHKTEEQVRFQRNQATYLVHLAAKTASKGLHCLSMRLTAEYFALRPEERKLPNENKISHPELHHYAVFSDNVLACAVVVNSTVSTAKGSEKPLWNWNVGRLPLGWLTFYNKTGVLDRRWHILGLGHNSGVDRNEIEQAAVIHYDGMRKPWLDIAMGRYKSYWTKFLNFDHPFFATMQSPGIVQNPKFVFLDLASIVDKSDSTLIA